MTKVRAGWLALAFSWAISIFLPHFVAAGLVFAVCISLLLLGIFIFAFHTLTSEHYLPNSWIDKFWVLVPVISYLVPLSLLYFYQFEKPYYLWTKLTAGSMTLNGNAYPLGDLAQITSAASCEVPIKVGTVVCDPWLRSLNQNTDVVEVFRILNLTNLFFVGLFIFILFIFVLKFVSKIHRASSFPILLFVSSPAILLAIERGNELLTISLLMLGFQLLMEKNIQLRLFGILLLFCASAFKLWPTFIIYVFVVLFRKNFTNFEKLLLTAPLIYWLVKVSEASEMIKSTQQGSLLGNSFGFKLWFVSGSKFSIILALILLSSCISYFALRTLRVVDIHLFANINIRDSKLITAYSLNYFVMWLIGDNFAYRLIALLPIVITLSKRQYRETTISKILLVGILITVFTIRLPITSAVSASLALTLFFVAIRLLNDPKVRNC